MLFHWLFVMQRVAWHIAVCCGMLRRKRHQHAAPQRIRCEHYLTLKSNLKSGLIQVSAVQMKVHSNTKTLVLAKDKVTRCCFH